MKIEVRKQENITILDLEGRLTLGTGDEALRRTIRGQIASGNVRIVLNLRSLAYSDSTGIGEMVAATQATQGAGGGLKLVEASDHLRNLLGMFPHVLQVYASEEEAIRSF